MKTIGIVVAVMLLSAVVHAQTNRHVLVIIRPSENSLPSGFMDNVRQRLRTVSFDRYEPSEQPTETIDVTSELSNGKEAYEFLRFEESIDILNKTVAKIKTHLTSDELLGMLKEADLYLTMDYLALDKTKDAQKTADEYLCISGTPVLDSNLWPPNLVNLVKDRKRSLQYGSIPVTVTTNPSEADVVIDGKSAGISPVHTDLLPCNHYLRVSKPSYRTKNTLFMVPRDTGSADVELAVDPLAMPDNALSMEQMKNLFDRYKVDNILLLSGTITQTTVQNALWIKATLIHPMVNTPSSVTFVYKDNDQASEELVRFIQPAPDVHLQSGALIKPIDIGSSDGQSDNQKTASASWYKNKWLWAAGAAIISGGILYAATKDNAHPSSTTGSLSVTW
jgi:hypothetical protein